MGAETGETGGISLQHFRKNVLAYGNVPLNALSDVKVLYLYCVSFYSHHDEEVSTLNENYLPMQ